jgi:hypothetical protein
MSKVKSEEPIYGNWLSSRLVYIPAAVGLMFLFLSLMFLILYVEGQAESLSQFLPFGSLTSMVVAVLVLSLCAYLAYARRKLSHGGGNVQAQIRQLVLNHLDWDGKGLALDIGFGNAPLTIAVAKRFLHAHVIGIDYWGGVWEYSKSVCEKKREDLGGRRSGQIPKSQRFESTLRGRIL